MHLFCYYLLRNIVFLYLYIERFDMIYYASSVKNIFCNYIRFYVFLCITMLHTRTKQQTYITNMTITGQIQSAIIYCVIRCDNYLAGHLVCYRSDPNSKNIPDFLCDIDQTQPS